MTAAVAFPHGQVDCCLGSLIQEAGLHCGVLENNSAWIKALPSTLEDPALLSTWCRRRGPQGPCASPKNLHDYKDDGPAGYDSGLPLAEAAFRRFVDTPDPARKKPLPQDSSYDLHSAMYPMKPEAKGSPALQNKIVDWTCGRVSSGRIRECSPTDLKPLRRSGSPV